MLKMLKLVVNVLIVFGVMMAGAGFMYATRTPVFRVAIGVPQHLFESRLALPAGVWMAIAFFVGLLVGLIACVSYVFSAGMSARRLGKEAQKLTDQIRSLRGPRSTSAGGDN